MVKKIILNDGYEIPVLGFGTYKSMQAEGVDAIINALHRGYRLIDTASIYENESMVAEAIKKSEVPRSEIILTTKLWRDNLGYRQAKEAFQASLDRLKLEYIDLYLIHWPANKKNYENWQRVNADTWRAFEELQEDGKIRSIGVSNFWQTHLEELFQTARVIPSVNQIEFHPGYWQPELTDFCQKNSIAIESWSPLARGKIFENKVLQKIAGKYNKSVSQICLRWVIQHDIIVIPKSSIHKRIEENIDIFDFNLSEEDIKIIDKLPQMGFSGELPDLWPEIVI
ncbi:aldo/keto reductase [Elizabethkingia anophelis]|uniref:aldo/keto reductase n=1 Tax=Elizabethkingia anophelis TaxID=1117645 RepID=UPI001367B9C7|nr:aldo/keto reductase [Elizabethkingia anophelis]MYY27286.1 aldo/keto reductase [Elizabethkingia anophelis]